MDISFTIVHDNKHTESEIISIQAHQDDIDKEQDESNNFLSIEQDEIDNLLSIEEDKPSDLLSQNLENEVINLCVSCVFNSWESIDAIMKAYGKKNGFTIIKKRIKHRSFGCEFGGCYQSRKQVDINKHKDPKFPTLSILNCDLTNAIQKYKTKMDITHDASHLLKTLIQHKSNDPGWFVDFQLDEENRLIRLFWMSPTQIAFECTKNATMTEPLVFVTDADPTANAAIGIYEELFYERWTNLIKKYSSVKGYLMRALYPSRQAWAHAFTSKIFTAGIQTTSRVEGLNNIIKHELKVNSTLCDLANVLASGNFSGRKFTENLQDLQKFTPKKINFFDFDHYL
ncbi:hypothetical protein Glove_302g18 [Diversispora epigaea]|uniref:MULE transposase domain-containing protein n=1 Tax=Diversispora epigaea TaxID=1348612 RepID=A0A397HW56_9GLOM|nr:hypothetical protein Glove_302g18 [Diversispora epigaea]